MWPCDISNTGDSLPHFVLSESILVIYNMVVFFFLAVYYLNTFFKIKGDNVYVTINNMPQQKESK